MNFTVYSTKWCGPCQRLKRDLRDAGIDFEEVDIELVPDAAKLVEKVNNANRTVPTLIFSDGTAKTNPSLASVRTRLGR